MDIRFMNNQLYYNLIIRGKERNTLTISSERTEKQDENDDSSSVCHITVPVTFSMLTNDDKIKFVLNASKRRFNYSQHVNVKWQFVAVKRKYGQIYCRIRQNLLKHNESLSEKQIPVKLLRLSKVDARNFELTRFNTSIRWGIYFYQQGCIHLQCSLKFSLNTKILKISN